MAVNETLNDDGTLVVRTVTDDETGQVLVQSFSPAPGTPAHDEPLNQQALANQLHALLPVLDDGRTHEDPIVRATCEGLLLVHKFIHADYKSPEV